MRSTLTKILIALLCCALPNMTSGQESSLRAIDSLEQILNASDNEFQKAYTLCDLARAASGIDSAKAYDYADAALTFFEKSKDSFGLAKAQSTMGFVAFDYNEMRESEKYYLKAKTIFESQMRSDLSKELMKLWADAALNLAASIGNQGRHDEELMLMKELAPIVKKHRNYKVLAIINSNLAITFFNNEDFLKSYNYFNGNAKNYERTTAYVQFATDRLIFSSNLMEMDSMDRAKKELDRAYTLLKKLPDSPRWQLYHQQVGEYFSKKGNYQKALEQYDKSMEIINEKKAYGALPQQYLQYVETYSLMGIEKKEKEYMLKFYEASKEENPPDALYALKELVKYEQRDKNLEQATAYAIRYFELNDSIKAADIEKETARLEQLYQKEKKEREIAELQIRNDKTDLDLERKRSQNYLLFILLGSLLFVLVSGYLTYRNRQKKALLVQKEQEQEIQVLKSEQERKLFGVMMEGVELERKRLAADLHDGLGGRLSGISIKLSKLTDTKIPKTVSTEIDHILQNIDASLQELRGVARNLMPETLLKYGLKAALEDYCSTLKDKETNIVLQCYNTDSIRDKNKLLTLYRIVQELINNAIKHADATEILVQFIHDNGKINITIEDDGVGFEKNRTDRNNGMGLANLNNRVNFLNGTMDVRSIVNEGTSVNIQIEQL